MAKTRLINDVIAKLGELDAALAEVQKEIDNEAPVTGPARQKIQQTFTAAMTAVAAMRTHLANLERRENNPKVADRLRNLKNVFKDKAELSRQRQTVRERFEAMDHRIVALRAQALGVLDEALNQYGTVKVDFSKPGKG